MKNGVHGTKRSKILHGTSTHEDGSDVLTVRRMAAASLRALTEWTTRARRMGEMPKCEGFMKELRHAEMAGSIMVGVPENLRRHLTDQ